MEGMGIILLEIEAQKIYKIGGLQVCHIGFIPEIDDGRKRTVHQVDVIVIIIITV
jgi:hypothetical protein